MKNTQINVSLQVTLTEDQKNLMTLLSARPKKELASQIIFLLEALERVEKDLDDSSALLYEKSANYLAGCRSTGGVTIPR